MAINEEARIPVYINDEQAKSALKNLAAEAEKWRKRMHEAMAGGDMKGMKEAERELKKTNQQAATLRKSAFDVNQILNNLSSASSKDIRKALQAVNKEMDGLNRNSKEYAALQLKAQALRKELHGVNGALRDQKGTITKLAEGVNKYIGLFAGTFAIGAAGKKLIGEADQAFTNFEERVSNLSALTKLQGEELDWLTQMAKDTAGATIEGNIRITQTAAEIADAYTVVGSKRPELLAVKEDLAAVTQEAIILAKASKGELSEAVSGLTMALNQFELSADQSRRVINVLAAGSQAGAGNVAYLTEAMEKSGTTANLMKIPIEEWTGAIEAVAPFYEKASVAGNSFDKILLKMKSNQIGYVNGQFNLNAALAELEKRYASGQSAVDIFGVEHAKMAEILVKNRSEVERYTQAVTDSDTAIEQAGINSDNHAERRKQAASNRNKALIEIGEMFAPVFTRAAEASAKAAEIMSDLIKIVADNKEVFFTLLGTVAAYTIAMQLANAESRARIVLSKAGAVADTAWATVKGVLTGKIKLATIAQAAWNAVMSMNPIGLIVTAIGALIAGVVLAWKRFDGFRGAVYGVWEVLKGLGEIIKVMVVDRFKEMLTGLGTIGKAFMALVKGQFGEAGKLAMQGIKNMAGADSAKKALEVGKSLGDKFKEGFAKGAKPKAEDVLPDTDEVKKAKEGDGDGGGGGIVIDPKERLKKLEEAYALEQAIIKRKQLEGKISEDQFKAEQLQAELKFYSDKLAILKAGSIEYEQTLNQALQKQADVDATIKKLLLDAEKELAAAKVAAMADGWQKQEALELQRFANEKANLQKRLVDKEVLSAEEQALNDTIYALIEQKELEHQERMRVIRGELAPDEPLEMADPMGFGTLEQIQSFYDQKNALLEKQFEKEKQAAGKNQVALAAAERRYSQQMLQLKKEQLSAEATHIQQRLSLAQSYISSLESIVNEESALGKALFLVSKALAIADIWVKTTQANVIAATEAAKMFAAAGPAAPALAAAWSAPIIAFNKANAAISTGIIAAQTVAKFAKGKKEGGFTDRHRTDDQVVDYVHANEFVANAQAVRNPTIKPILDIIDIAQKNGTIASLNLPAMLGHMGRRSGGFHDPSSMSYRDPAPDRPPSETIVYQKDPELLDAINRLNENLEKGIKAKLFYRDLEEYEKKVKETRDNANI